jgi:hypothetical protein
MSRTKPERIMFYLDPIEMLLRCYIMQDNHRKPNLCILDLHILGARFQLIKDFRSNLFVLNWKQATVFGHDIGKYDDPLTYRYLWSNGRDSNTRFSGFAVPCIGPLCHRCINFYLTGIFIPRILQTLLASTSKTFLTMVSMVSRSKS